MQKFTKDDIVAKAAELAKMIAETEEVDFLNGRKRKSMKMRESAI